MAAGRCRGRAAGVRRATVLRRRGAREREGRAAYGRRFVQRPATRTAEQGMHSDQCHISEQDISARTCRSAARRERGSGGAPPGAPPARAGRPRPRPRPSAPARVPARRPARGRLRRPPATLRPGRAPMRALRPSCAVRVVRQSCTSPSGAALRYAAKPPVARLLLTLCAALGKDYNTGENLNTGEN